jgi:alkylhydroperoxidase family enzyme
MARVQGVEPERAGLLARLTYFVVRRRFGRVPEPVSVLAHHPTMLAAYGAFETGLDRARRVPARLKVLGELRVAQLVGCPF